MKTKISKLNHVAISMMFNIDTRYLVANGCRFPVMIISSSRSNMQRTGRWCLQQANFNYTLTDT